MYIYKKYLQTSVIAHSWKRYANGKVMPFAVLDWLFNWFTTFLSVSLLTDCGLFFYSFSAVVSVERIIGKAK